MLRAVTVYSAVESLGARPSKGFRLRRKNPNSASKENAK